MERKNETTFDKRIFLLILGVTTILIALIGATFAYFTAVVNNVNGNQSITLTTAKIEGIIYTAEEPLMLLQAIPGDHKETTFTIKNPNETATANYTMTLVTDVNDFETTDGANQLVVTLTGGQLTTSQVFDMTDGNNTNDRVILSEVPLAAGATDEYGIKIEFREIGDSQNTNQRKTFAAHIEVTQSLITMQGE